MKVSHELPLQLLEKNNEWNDFDFILPKYWEESPEYKEYYKQSTRFKIADCGLYEGKVPEEEKLISFINELQPDFFVIPDVWNDAKQSYRNAQYWQKLVKSELPPTTKLCAVIQCTDIIVGSTLYQRYLDLGIEAIAFNHSSEAYKKLFPHENIFISKMMGRIYFINYLKDKNIIDPNIYHHLLGANSFLEFKTYQEKEYNFINSCDTSNPIIFGLKEQNYTFNNCWDKPKEKIEVWFDKKITENQLKYIENNLERFKELIKI